MSLLVRRLSLQIYFTPGKVYNNVPERDHVGIVGVDISIEDLISVMRDNLCEYDPYVNDDPVAKFNEELGDDSEEHYSVEVSIGKSDNL